ncbi:MAG: trimeric intracellular cation channel family protein [Pseudoxanthomonas sp.]
MIQVTTLVSILDLVGTFVFAISGATAAARRRLDVFGVLVVAFVAGNFGGITRDLLIGAVPPAALDDGRYLLVSLLAGMVAFRWHAAVEKLYHPVLIFDAMGLALFAVAGAQKALVFGLHPVMAALLGMVTAVGGGMMRDVLLNQVPAVLRADLYAVVALAGASVVVVGHWQHWPPAVSASGGAGLCFLLRVLALRYDWHLPVAPGLQSGDGSKDPDGDAG